MLQELLITLKKTVIKKKEFGVKVNITYSLLNTISILITLKFEFWRIIIDNVCEQSCTNVFVLSVLFQTILF